MTYEEFVKLTSAVRQAQKIYFRERSPQALNASKELERRLDKAIEAYFDKQKRMF